MTAGLGLPLPADNLGELKGYHSPQVDVPVRLNTNESPYPPPTAFLDALAAAVADTSFHRYPDRGARALRADLARLHGVRPEQVFCANGSNEVLQTLFLTYGGPGRKAGVFEPSYAMHAQIAHLTHTELVVGERAEDFTLPPSEVARVLAAGPDLTFVTSPNNPTGRIEPKDLIADLVATVPGLLVVDEAYGQFASFSALEFVADDLPLVVTRTYSKTWSMAGTRLGYLVGPASVVTELEARVLPYHLDALKQAAGRIALRFTDAMEERVGALVAERERIASGLNTLAVQTWPSEANFLLFRPLRADGTVVWQGLVAWGVLVRNCDTWPRLAGCLRVTVGTPDEGDRFLDALAEVLADVSAEAPARLSVGEEA